MTSHSVSWTPHPQADTRRRSAEQRSLKKLNHEHVLPRKWLREQMKADPSRCEEIIASAIGCVVTREEHERLTTASRLNPELQGWERYQAAGVAVYDMATGDGLDLTKRSSVD